jgi:hypothetical protein
MAGGLTQVFGALTAFNSTLQMCPMMPQESPIQTAIKSFRKADASLQDQFRDLPNVLPKLNIDLGNRPKTAKKIEKVKLVDISESVGQAFWMAMGFAAMICFLAFVRDLQPHHFDFD